MYLEVQPNGMVGVVLGGAYQITGLLAEGGMGSVYEARHLRLNKRVAVKLLARDLAANREALARFHREAEVTSQLGHPHLVSVLDFGTTDEGKPYLVMERLEGEDLERRLLRDKCLPLGAVVAITKQVASALGAAHAAGIVHRDLKPANLFLVKVTDDEDDFVKVLDFGISKVKAGRTKLTQGTSVLGTPEYMSPEQANGLVEDIDHRVDQWSLACIVWEMLTGHSPFVADDVSAVFYRIINADPHPLSSLAPGLPPTIEPVLRRALSKQVADRYPSIKEFSRMFESAALGRSVEVTPAPISVSIASTAPAASAVSRSGERRITQGYGESQAPGSSASRPGLAGMADAPEPKVSSNASTFEARVLWSTEADRVEDALSAASTRRRYPLAAVVGIAAGAVLAVAIVAFRPRKSEPMVRPAHEAVVVPAVRALPEQAIPRTVAPAPPTQPPPLTQVQREEAEQVAERPAHPSPAAPPSKPGGPVLAGHKGAAASVKKLEDMEALRGGSRQAHPEDPFAAPFAPDRGDPFQPDEPTSAEKAATPESGYADPFEHEAPPAKSPTATKQAVYVGPFEHEETPPTPSPRAKAMNGN
jgi:serine/threonine protein kinase